MGIDDRSDWEKARDRHAQSWCDWFYAEAQREQYSGYGDQASFYTIPIWERMVSLKQGVEVENDTLRP